MNYILGLILLYVIGRIVFKAIHYGISFMFGGILDRSNRYWVIKYFKGNANVDQQRVVNYAKNLGSPPPDFSPWEMVAVFGLIVSETTVSETVKLAQRLGDHGWETRYAYDFYSILEQTALNVLWKMNNPAAFQLLKFGKALAESRQDNYWSLRFLGDIERETHKMDALRWDASRRTHL